MTELLTRQRNRRRINDRGHLFNVVEKEPVKQDLVCVLEGSQVNMPFQVIRFSLKGFVCPSHLLIKSLYLRRK